MSLWLHRRSIVRLAAGELDAARGARLRQHLASCPACRRYYDGLALVAGERPKTERARLAAALATKPATSRPRRPALAWRLAIVAAPALCALVLLATRLRVPPTPPAPAPEPDITWRGPPPKRESAPAARALDPEALRAGLVLRVYASRRAPDGTAGPVRLVGELPGSGELRVSRGDYVQLAQAGLKEQRYLAVFAAGDDGRPLPFWPRPAAPSATLPPSAEARPLGRSLALGALGLAGRAHLLAVVSTEPISAAFGVAAAKAALGSEPAPLPVVVLDGLLTIEP